MSNQGLVLHLDVHVWNDCKIVRCSVSYFMEVAMKVCCPDGVHPCGNVFEAVPNAHGWVYCPKCKGGFRASEHLAEQAENPNPPVPADQALPPGRNFERVPGNERWCRA